jgi:signal transduction histidine kinase
MATDGEREIKLLKSNSGIKRRLVVNYLTVILVVMFLLEIFFVFFLYNFYYSNVEQTLSNRISVTANFFSKYFPADISYFEGPKKYIEEYQGKDEFLLQLINMQGKVILSTNGFGDNRTINTPDILGALDGKNTKAIYHDPKTNEKLIAVSSPIKVDKTIFGIMRLSTSLTDVDAMIQNRIWISLIVEGLIAGLFVLVSIFFSKTIINPLNEINVIAKKMSKGQLNARIEKKYNDEIGELSDTLNYMASEMFKVQQLKSDFISSISHELRTPLTSIRGWSETILTGDLENKEETKQGLQVIIKEANRLTQMVEELLDFSRLEGGRMVLHLTPLNIIEELNEILSVFHYKALKEKVEIEFTHPKEVSDIIGDKNRLKQVFINILDNALKFSPPQTAILVEIQEIRNRIIVNIIDKGLGIASEDLPKIKEKFYKGKSQKQGSGIGLGIVDEIVKLHGGEFNIYSEFEKGTKVQIQLPINQ